MDLTRNGHIPPVSGASAGIAITARRANRRQQRATEAGERGAVAAGGIGAQTHNKRHPTAAARRAFIANNLPAGYFGESGIAYWVAFLASPLACCITTGAAMPMDGGCIVLPTNKRRLKTGSTTSFSGPLIAALLPSAACGR